MALRLIDDHRSGTAAASAGGAWRFFSDGVMGGVSTGGTSVETVDGRAALCLRGQVRLANGGGFVQMALELPSGGLPPDAAEPALGLEIDVRGRPLRYGVHLRTTGMSAPWQSWRARLDAGPAWRTLRLPFDAFEPYRIAGRLDPAAVRRIGLVALGEAGEAELWLGRLAVY